MNLYEKNIPMKLITVKMFPVRMNAFLPNNSERLPDKRLVPKIKTAFSDNIRPIISKPVEKCFEIIGISGPNTDIAIPSPKF